MKQFYLKTLLLCAFALVGMKAAAVYDCKVDGIYYNLSEDQAEVTHGNLYGAHINGQTNTDVPQDFYTGEVIIPESVTWDGKTYPVTGIGKDAFFYCTKLTAVTIPNSITSIDETAFSKCSGLSITLNSSAILNANYRASKSLSTIFGSSMTTLTIGEGIERIGEYAFYQCKELVTLNLPNSMKHIGDSAFENSGLQEVSFGSGLESIGRFAFADTQITSVTLPDNIMSMDSPFSWNDPNDDIKVYVRRGSETLLSAWFGGVGGTLYDVVSGERLERPSINIMSTTQTTAEIELSNRHSEYQFYLSMSGYSLIEFTSDVIKVTGLAPQLHGQLADLYAQKGSRKLPICPAWGEMQKISPSLDISTTASAFVAKGSYLEGDAVVESEKITINGNDFDGNQYKGHGLDPQTKYNVTYSFIVRYGENKELSQTYKTSATVTTDPLTLTTSQPKVISEGNVIVAAESNIDDAEENVGFEWRRQDWPDNIASNTGAAYLYEGTMEGYIRNLNANYLWKFRPYYLSDGGTYYYGDWVGLDPSNTSYFEPTVHTYATITVEGNTALVKGYALRGTDNVKVQGFKYWKSVASAKAADGISKAPAVPDNALSVEASGQVMTASLENLDYETTYSYAAFVTTTEGETFYGEVQTFTTPVDESNGVENVTARQQSAEIVGYYDLQGKKLNGLQRGLNIIRMSDGTTRKVAVK